MIAALIPVNLLAMAAPNVILLRAAADPPRVEKISRLWAPLTEKLTTDLRDYCGRLADKRGNIP
jgi:hypothetical protein